jgi:hypothetical protein
MLNMNYGKEPSKHEEEGVHNTIEPQSTQDLLRPKAGYVQYTSPNPNSLLKGYPNSQASILIL